MLSKTPQGTGDEQTKQSAERLKNSAKWGLRSCRTGAGRLQMRLQSGWKQRVGLFAR